MNLWQLLVVLSCASQPSEVDWKLALPYSHMPKAVRDRLQPSEFMICNIFYLFEFSEENNLVLNISHSADS